MSALVEIDRDELRQLLVPSLLIVAEDYSPGTITTPLPFNGVALGVWDGTSGYFNYVVTVSEDGKTSTGVEARLAFPFSFPPIARTDPPIVTTRRSQGRHLLGATVRRGLDPELELMTVL
jgi:hypothetical protein